MRQLTLVGIGAGDPDHLTAAAARALIEADAILLPVKGEDRAELAEIRRTLLHVLRNGAELPIVEFSVPDRDPGISDYAQRVDHWHQSITRAWTTALAGIPSDACIVLPVWGDPSLYDSALRIAGRVNDSLPPQDRLVLRVLPGLTAPQLLTAAHGITLNDINGCVLITTGRRLRDHGWPDGADRLVVMLDGECSFTSLDPAGVTIWWGACLGMADREILMSGPLGEVGQQIIAARAGLRKRHGWVMDVYLLARAGLPATVGQGD